MTAKAESNFLKKQLDAAANINDPQILAHLRSKQEQLHALVQQPPNLEAGRKFPVLARRSPST